ncbi:uncharacterized protein (DUF58 family) [Allocatelliglobosispora scoriae]|uniref:Uncharacterized protein (DUF58 family) n=1 Tax=Allocatelliglobosispora scoriae TaxID=643052 RepID=A0A841BMW4_9ACTN|nr:DUF58 domain-containing protein [Allocatelliglobosispora scoriae]MBB5868616.1 uncharacterized protein (DUF58 family) [Allocatelliglobosispora scoriae]
MTAVAVGLALGYPLLLVVGSGMAAALVTAVVLVGRQPRWQVSREVGPDQVERGESALGRVTFRNTGRTRTPAVTAYDAVSGQLAVPVALVALDPGGTRFRTYPLPTQRRGRYEIGPLTIRREDPLGLARRSAVMATVEELWVLPKLHPVRRVPSGRGSGHGAATAETLFRGSSDFRSLREYVLGDEVKNLHWKSTARAGQLMVREFTDPWRPSVTILLDNRALALSPDAFEEAVEVAASVHRAAVRADCVVTLALTAPDPGGPAGARHHLDRDMQRLCLVAQQDAPAVAVPTGGASCLVFVSGGESAVDRATLSTLKRRADLVIVVDLASSGEAPGVPYVAATSADAAVAQWNALVGR